MGSGIPAKPCDVWWAKDRTGLREYDPESVCAVMECARVDRERGIVVAPLSACDWSDAKSLSLTASPVKGNCSSASRLAKKRDGMAGGRSAYECREWDPASSSKVVVAVE